MDSVELLYEKMLAKLGKIMPAVEIRAKADIAQQILQLKEKRNAVILGHNYMEPALYYSVPDFVGDSLELSRKAAETDRDIIVFCGVRFMAETAKIISPEKTVLLPSPKGGCSLAQSITADDVKKLKQQFPGVPVVTYVNTYADVKAETDICCTSGNAAAVVESLPGDTVIFLPDEYLAKNVARETGKHIIFPTRSKKENNSTELHNVMIGWEGRCEVHEQFTVEQINSVRQQFPHVCILAHPECPPQVVEAADFAGSTSAMIKFVKNSKQKQYLLLTECSMADNIMAENPEKEMLRLCSVTCPHMKEITLEQTLDSLSLNQYVIDVPEHIRIKAKKAVDRMLEIG
ncbi:quinolinate synthase NadA [candidate division KSB1 bacterium]|nr:quinolinate synthase NadA [candidate division KSB1 bacterium]